MLAPLFLIKITDFYAQAKNWVFEVFVPEKSNKYLPGALRPRLLFCYSSILLLIKIATISLVLVLPYSSFFSAITQDRLISLINQARQNNGLLPVSLNKILNETADFKVNDMLANNYFEHTSPSGITPWAWFKKAGYNYAYAGENLAIDFAETDDVFSAWMASPAHRDNILSPNFNEIGLAIKNGSLQNHNATLAVLVFGKQSKKDIRSNVAKSQPEIPKASPKTQVLVKPLSVSITQKTPKQATSTTQLSASPSTGPLTSASPDQILTQKENIELKSIAGEITENSRIDSEPTKISDNLSLAANKWTPKVLGAFASKADEVTKSFFLYFTLFLTLALLVNIFVKIETQYWQTIFSTTLVILLSSVLIFI